MEPEQKTAHTPTPWKVDCKADICTSDLQEMIMKQPNHQIPSMAQANAAFIVKAVNCHQDLLEACKAVDIYFKALVAQWATNQGRVVSEVGTVISGSEEVARLCEIAGIKVKQVVARAEGKQP